MNTLKFKQESNSEKMTKERRMEGSDDLINLFPQPRYFQVHFQHIHENTHDLHDELAQLKNYVIKVDKKLERLVKLLSRLPEHAL